MKQIGDRRIRDDAHARQASETSRHAARTLDVLGDSTEPLTQALARGQYIRIQGDLVPPMAALPDSRLRDQLRAAEQRGARDGSAPPAWYLLS